MLAALLLAAAPLALAQVAEAPPVQRIQIEQVGPPAASEDLIRANIRTRVGAPYSRAAIDSDVRSLYATGYFSNVRVGEDRSSQGVSLTYVLVGKPVLMEIEFSGNSKYSRKRLLRKITSKTGEPIDERKLFADKQEILKLYQKKGYQKTQVDYKLKDIDEQAGRGKVLFEIKESPRVRIKEVNFIGAQAISENKLRRVVKTRRRWMLSWITGSGVLKDEQLEDDREKLAQHYRSEGYIDFSLDDVQFRTVEPGWIALDFHISEGRQYKVGAVEFKGNSTFGTDQIQQGVVVEGKTIQPAMGVGETFTPRGLIQDVEAIQDFYGSKGYIGQDNADRIPVRAVRNPNVETGTMDIVYQIAEGEPSYIEKIDIRGNTKTKDRVIRRELSVIPGEVFDMTRAKRSRTRLEGLGYFEKVETQVEPTDVPNRKNLVVGVEEKNTGRLYFGAGFSTIDEIVGFVELYQGNFDLFQPPAFQGGGQKLRLRVAVGSVRQDYTLNFVEPWFLGRKLALSVDGFHRQLDFLSPNDYYEERQTGGRVGLKRALGTENLIGGVSYTLQNIGIVDVIDGAPPSIQAEEGYSLLSEAGVSIAYDTRNHALQPDRGQRTELTADIAGGPLGAEKDFYRFELRSTWYFRGLADKHIIELTGAAGVVDSYGDSETVPFYERWFLGGMYTLRGFDYRMAGSDDTFEDGSQGAEPVGGGSYWFASAEYSVPLIFERLRLALFYDIGNVYRKAYEFDPGEYLDNWGVGIRFNSPFGPLRFDYGIPITTGRHTGDSGQFHFGVGYTREF